MLDLHTHILHGVDDGATSAEESVEMARCAVADGIHTVVATPHVRDGAELTSQDIRRHVDALRRMLAKAGVELTILTGAEVSIDAARRLGHDELAALGLGGASGFLLLETPYAGWRLDLGELVTELVGRGQRPVIAHPERCLAVQHRPELVEPLVAGGALVQLTAQSLSGGFGRRTANTARALLERGTAHLLASDAHDPVRRPVALSTAAALLDPPLARWLTTDMPRAIVSGDELPARPPARRGRVPWRRGRLAFRRER
jgi:protein-tyrosine phosphatase